MYLNGFELTTKEYIPIVCAGYACYETKTMIEIMQVIVHSQNHVFEEGITMINYTKVGAIVKFTIIEELGEKDWDLAGDVSIRPSYHLVEVSLQTGQICLASLAHLDHYLLINKKEKIEATIVDQKFSFSRSTGKFRSCYFRGNASEEPVLTLLPHPRHKRLSQEPRFLGHQEPPAGLHPYLLAGLDLENAYGPSDFDVALEEYHKFTSRYECLPENKPVSPSPIRSAINPLAIFLSGRDP